MHFTLGEINIISTDLVRSLHFYKNILGFKETGKGEGFVHLDCNGQPFTLLQFAKEELKNYNYGDLPTISIDLMADNIEETVKRFNELNVGFVKEWKPGDTHTFIYDPDKLVFEIIQKK